MKSNKTLKNILKRMPIFFSYNRDKAESYIKEFAYYYYNKHSPRYKLYNSKELLHLLYTYPEMYTIIGWGNDKPRNDKKDYYIDVLFNDKFFDKYDYELRKNLFVNKEKSVKCKCLINNLNNKIILDEELMEASQYGHLYDVKVAVHSGARLCLDNDEPLKVAAENGYLEVVKFLVEEGSHVNAENDYALRMAAKNKHLDVIKFLVEHEANVNAENDYALRWAAYNGGVNMVKFLVENGADVNANHGEALKWAAYNGHLDVVKFLVENKADINIIDDTVLNDVKFRGYQEIVDYLEKIIKERKDMKTTIKKFICKQGYHTLYNKKLDIYAYGYSWKEAKEMYNECLKDIYTISRITINSLPEYYNIKLTYKRGIPEFTNGNGKFISRYITSDKNNFGCFEFIGKPKELKTYPNDIINTLVNPGSFLVNDKFYNIEKMRFYNKNLQ